MDPVFQLSDRIAAVETKVAVHGEVVGSLKGSLNNIEHKLDKVVGKLDEASKQLLVIDINKANGKNARKALITLIAAILSSGILSAAFQWYLHH